jgi:hypothetical protein
MLSGTKTDLQPQFLNAVRELSEGRIAGAIGELT